MGSMKDTWADELLLLHGPHRSREAPEEALSSAGRNCGGDRGIFTSYLLLRAKSLQTAGKQFCFTESHNPDLSLSEMQVSAFLKKQSQGEELVLPFLDTPKMWESASPTAPSMKNLCQEPHTSPTGASLGQKSINYSRKKGKTMKMAVMLCITFQVRFSKPGMLKNLYIVAHDNNFALKNTWPVFQKSCNWCG